MFRLTDNRGFQITFDNGWTVSVQFGSGNYCNNRDLHALLHGKSAFPECENAEIAAWPMAPEGARPCEHWHVFSEYKDDETSDVWGQEHVKGWVKPDEVLAFMNEIANKPKE